MQKRIFTSLPYLFVLPHKYFKDNILNTDFKKKELIFTGILIISLSTLIYFFESKISIRYNDWIGIVAHLTGFVIGMSFSFIFQTYFITIVLKKGDIEVDYKKIGILVAITMITNILMFLIPIIIRTNLYNDYIELIFRILNLSLVIIGIIVLTKIKFFRALLIVLVMFGFEMMFSFVIGGIRI